MVSHGIMTGLLFTIVNLVYHKSHLRDMTRMGGYAHAMPGLACFFVIAGLTSLGLPGLSGFVAEFLVFLGAWTSDHAWWLFPAVLGAFVTALYVLRAVKMIFLGPPNPHGHEIRDAVGIEWVTLVVLGGLLIVLGIWPRWFLDPIHTGVGEMLARLGGGA
jgi:NADH-quinone oxidoreductase subunit M